MSVFAQIQTQFPHCTFDIHRSNVAGRDGAAYVRALDSSKLRWFGICGWQNEKKHTGHLVLYYKSVEGHQTGIQILFSITC